MTSIARRLLDELMGPDRNKPLGLQGQSSVRYTQAEVCKYYLVGFCPYELFLNTKSDIGPCPWRIHDPIIKEEFERIGAPGHREAYERQFHDKCWELLRDLERRLKRGKERLDLPDQAGASASGASANEEVEEKRALLEHQIKQVLAQVEELGEEGRVREAQERMVQADMLQAELDRLKQLEADNPLYRLEKKMELCPTCGAFLIVNDAPMRIQAHYAGRQHNGWVQLRSILEKYKATRQAARREGYSRPQDEGASSSSYSRRSSITDSRHPQHRSSYGSSRSRYDSSHSSTTKRSREDERGERYDSSSSSSRRDDHAHGRDSYSHGYRSHRRPSTDYENNNNNSGGSSYHRSSTHQSYNNNNGRSSERDRSHYRR